MVSDDTLANYYETNFALMQYHKYSLSDLENMMCWERDVYIGLLIRHLEQEKERQKAEQNKRK